MSCPFNVCHGPRTLNLVLTTGAIPVPGVETAGCLLLWGLNPTDAALPRHLRIQQAGVANAKVIVANAAQTDLPGSAL
jgi:anaerobic selenocysteine-containing dehydrogenase